VTEWIHQIVQWAGSHSHAAYLVVGFVAFLESLAFVGLIVPGVVILFGAGALVANGALGLWPTLGAAVIGAIAGDGLSYWFGRHYRNGIRNWWPFRRRVELLERAEAFVRRHGGKSVLFGRFVGPLRPVVPAVAGMLGMSAGRFYLVNVASALVWAPVYLLPGMAVGLSLMLAREVAGRLAFLLGILFFAGWAIVGVIRWIYDRVCPRVLNGLARGSARAGSRPRISRVLNVLFAPGQPAYRIVTVWLALLVAGAWLFLGVLEDVVTRDPLVAAGESVYHLLQQWRTPLGDRIMVILSELGDASVVVPVVVVVLAGLVWRRAWWDAFCWAAAGAFGALALAVIKATVGMPRPSAIGAGVDAYSFPSGHATMSMVVYGFLAVLLSPTLSARLRWISYAVAALLIGGIAFSRLYLGAHWLADVAGGLGLGLAWVALLALARRWRMQRADVLHGLTPLILVTFLVCGGWHISSRMADDMDRYAVRYSVQMMPAEDWWTRDWRRIPPYRMDHEGEREQPLNLQWAGSLPAVRRYLLAKGWTDPLPLSVRTALRWLLPSPRLKDLPILPQLHNGRYESLCLVLRGNARTTEGDQIVLRLWPTSVRLNPWGSPLWAGNVTLQHIRHLPLVRFPATVAEYERPLSVLSAMVTDTQSKAVRRQPADRTLGRDWPGDVLLLRQDAPGGP
jgi:undecaprenyl-diphosphatase